ncbi:MAG: hypothetical protein AAF541_11455 [Pseudomonadota bacterium]
MQESSLRSLAIIVLVPFTALTTMAIYSDGINGFPNAITYNFLSFQIWLDLVIAMLFWCAWVILDARAHGRSPWGWVVAALLFGAFSPLIYILVHKRWPATPARDSAATDDVTSRRTFAAIAFTALLVVTLAGLAIDGTDIMSTITHSWSNIQIWVDLVIVILLWAAWMFADAKTHDINPWGWLVFAAALGSFSPLLYLLVHGRWPASHPTADQPVST